MINRIFILACFIVMQVQVRAQIFQTQNGKIQFKSDALLEIIEAKTDKLRGAINVENRTFAFTVPVQSFKGFNSALQQIHFNENYLESDVFANATFVGKIIENIDFTKDGNYTVRAKGKLTIHGIEQERIIKSILVIKNGNLDIESAFTVLLQEHNILIPKIISQKIAEEIFVRIEAELSQ